ncbi:pyruvate dehydrogenase phosphatase regulatory subunit, mitochondrial-like [Odontomachus brunneus]|uniref:pyruvate dehydrogenase phosphatase regulatory subunit, mitochondrial-like n=1 Tax=Odontomachus brunneus TaxID=486640 RepID=UPI0013F1F332|nr:pyruvate dehydrogenase phosphatase regulatory subunit, mitochondrial-like [Odontomachus brunneus]XP_032689935.1 pyruvate dehydrogenase phosphatase regulatory subunit, mitochondrial-like [Odontomachus brunneus]
MTKRLVLLVLNGIDINKDVWAWGGEPLYRNGQFVGTVTSTGYDFVIEKLICLGFISLPGTRHEQEIKLVTTNFIMGPSARYEVDIAGTRFPAELHVYPLPIPAINSKLNKKYITTPVISYQTDVLC